MKSSLFLPQPGEDAAGLFTAPRGVIFFGGFGAGFAVRSRCTGALGATSGAGFAGAGTIGVFAGLVFARASPSIAAALAAGLGLAGGMVTRVTGGVFGGAAGLSIFAATEGIVVFGVATPFVGEFNVCVIFGNGAGGVTGFSAAAFGVEGAAGAFVVTGFGVGRVSITGVSLTAAGVGTGGAAFICGLVGAAEGRALGFFPAVEVLIAFVEVIADGLGRGVEIGVFGFLPEENLAMRGQHRPFAKSGKAPRGIFPANLPAVVPKLKM